VVAECFDCFNAFIFGIFPISFSNCSYIRAKFISSLRVKEVEGQQRLDAAKIIL